VSGIPLRTLLGILSILVVLAGIAYGAFHFVVNGYNRTLSANWELSLPDYAGVAYEADDSGWMGDGDRYHVFRYADGTAIGVAVGWQSGEDPAVTAAVREVLGPGAADGCGISGLNVPEDEWPDFSACRWFSARGADDARNELYLLLDGNTLYVVERFF